MYRIDTQVFTDGIKYLNEWFDLQLENSDIQITTLQGNRNAFAKRQNEIRIEYVDKASFYRLFVSGLRAECAAYVEPTDSYRHLTYMLDCSRNAVINVASAKRLIGHLCIFGYDELSLYTEDTYEVQNEPCFGYLRGRFSQEEMQDIIRFADMFGITVTLSVQCLAHMRSIYRHETYYKEAFDCNDVLMVGSKRVESLLENMFASIAKMLPSKAVNIGMDESFMLGRGKYLNQHGYVKPEILFLEQLKTVVRIAEKYGLHLKMWGDCLEGNYTNRDEIAQFAKEHHIKVVFWRYGGPNEGQQSVEQVCTDLRDHYLKERKETYSDCCFCMSDHKFFGLAPHNHLALHINQAYVEAAIQSGIDEIWLSSWGDCGAEVSPFATLPVMAYVGYAVRFSKEIGSFESFFTSLFGSLKAFLMLDYANCLSEELDLTSNTSSKYFLYQDVFMGVMDQSVKSDYKYFYQKHIDELEDAKSLVLSKYEYLFDTQIRLLNAILRKHTLGNQTREAFLEKNNKKMLELLPLYEEVIENIRAFFNAFQKQWYHDNKVFGFEIQEARIGALIFRIENCMTRLEQFCNGDISDLPELREEILNLFGSENNIIMLNWGELISSGVMIEYTSFV